MTTASAKQWSGRWPALTILLACAMLAFTPRAFAVGTPVGTSIDNQATVNFNLAGTPVTLQSNPTTIIVAERLDIVVTRQSGQVLVSPSDTARAILYTVANTGNGTEAVNLTMDSALGGDDFDPVPAVPAIYFDTDGSGDFNVGDVAYNPGVNDPVLAADATIDVFIVNDIPAGVVNGNLGSSQLTATAATGSGAPGTIFAGQGDAGTDAIVGATGAEDTEVGEYLVSDVLVNVVKSQAVSDPFGGTSPIPGATITYTITVEVSSAGTATAAAVRDVVPTFTTFVPGSITLNAASLTDAVDVDAGELDTAGAPTVVVRLGDLTQADGVQTVVFEVTIDQ
ncbi:MAG: hypothetical protein AAF351_10570 [Pseudomonadota bacterium]